MKKTLPPRYQFKEAEKKWTAYWKEHNLYHAEVDKNKKPFTIVIPPPNITGILHMGHAFNNTLQDILIRFKRMQGFASLWMPGTDHAGIATQNVVEKQLAREGKTRYDIGREEMLKKLWAWKKEYGDTIIHQLERLGASCDWPRTRFTMDEHYSQVVREVFVRLYEKGLIYRGHYIINWCPRCQTALSDEEAEHQEEQGSLYYIRYALKENPSRYLTVATTRPETMLGDTAVAVNPVDSRYKSLIGKVLILPLLKREIPVISDAFVDPEFGTGAVKVTPAHDPNDFEIGKRHNLSFINIFNADATLNDNAGPFKGLDRFKGRQAVIDTLKKEGLLEKVEKHQHAVGHCYRCNTTVEPYLSQQWFVKMKPLAKPAIDVVRKGEIKFYPSRWTKVYLNWMENIRDWCISRQIWWGHRIPVWYCSSCPEGENLVVSRTTPQKCPRCGSANLHQDEDVLDTWFSSWLWPFATFYWPEEREDLKFFYPTSVLVTASEIIFFWVARMIMAGLEFTGKIPFSDVFIHGTVRDAKGIKMSKSLGNTIDPLEIIAEYGADALRFSLIVNSGQDLFISKEKFEIGRNFANKVWNATRFILMQISDENAIKADWDPIAEKASLDITSRWILSQLQRAIQQITESLEKYRFSEAETVFYDFFWRIFCDWYLEITKEKKDEPLVQKTAVHVLLQSLILLHPFMPYVTEEIWHILFPSSKSIAIEKWPIASSVLIDEKSEKTMKDLTELISAIRQLRATWNISKHEVVQCLFLIQNPEQKRFVLEHKTIIQSLAKCEGKLLESSSQRPKEAATGIGGGISFFIPLSGIIDIRKEKERIQKQLAQQQNSLRNLSQRLTNKTFLEKAPKEIIAKETARQKELQEKIEELQQALKDLS